MDKMPSNKYWLNHVIKTLKTDEKVQNYQVRYKFFKNSEKVKFLVVKVKFNNYTVKMRIYNEKS